MNITRNSRIATAAVVAFAALTGPAMAAGTVGTISAGHSKPQVAWDHNAWKKCWTLSYKQAREDGHSPNGATAYADLVCGAPPA